MSDTAAAAAAATAAASSDPKAGTFKATTSAKKEKKKRTTKKSSGKKSYLGQVEDAIRELRDADGSSRAAIAKLLKTKGSDNKNALSRALKQGIKSGKLEQGTSKSRFRIAGLSFAKKDDGFRKTVVKGGESGSSLAEEGDTVVVGYIGRLESDGSCFDSAKSFTFTLGAGEVIKGWDRGVKGMRVGEKAKLLCECGLPLHLLYYVVSRSGVRKRSRPVFTSSSLSHLTSRHLISSHLLS